MPQITASKQMVLKTAVQGCQCHYICIQKVASQRLNSDKNFDTIRHIYMDESSQKSRQCAHLREMMLTKHFSKHIYPAVGVLISTWFKDEEIDIYQYSTAWLVAPQFLITCQHSIYSQKNDEQASQILFFPGVAKGKLSTFCFSKSKNFYRAKKMIKFKQTFTFKPTINELCLIVLQKPVQIAEYVKIGSLELYRFSSIEIIGYPNNKYWRQINVKLVTVQRNTSKGCIQTVQDNIINYTNPTEIGMSGGPILAKARNGEVYAIGIHTHSGFTKGINRGLFFTRQVLRYLVSYERQLSLIHQIKQGIVYKDTYGDYCIQGCKLLKGTEKEPNSQIQLDNQYLGDEKQKNQQSSEMQQLQEMEVQSKQYFELQEHVEDKNIQVQVLDGRKEGSIINQEQSVDSEQFQKVFDQFFKEYYLNEAIFKYINRE